MILELIGQPYFDLKWNNSQNVWNKCFINCFRIDSLSANLKDITMHTSVNATLLSFGFLHNRDTILACYASWKRWVLQNLYLTVIFQIIIKCDAHAQNSKSLFLYISAVSEIWINVTQINFENIKRKIQRIISDSEIAI